jgi:ribonuclease T1
VRRLLRDRRTYAAALVLLVLAAVAIGQLRDDDPGGPTGTPAGTPSIDVSPDGGPTTGATPDDEPTRDDPRGPTLPTAVAPTPPPSDIASGLSVVSLADLPPEATETVARIAAGGPFPYADDGETFLNSAGLLPDRAPGYYRVYTVETPGSVEPTLRRIVTGTDGELYWTDDLYESFRRIEE